jgi:hypothetical protein
VRLVEDEVAEEKKGSFLPPDRFPMAAAGAGGGLERGSCVAWCGTGRRTEAGRTRGRRSIWCSAEWAGLERHWARLIRVRREPLITRHQPDSEG